MKLNKGQIEVYKKGVINLYNKIRLRIFRL